MVNMERNFGRGRTKLRVKVRTVGEDVVVFVNGGESHIGSIAVAFPRPSLDDPGRISSTTSVFNMIGHKDDYLSKPLADELASETGRTVVVVAGFHLADITKNEINNVLKNLKAAAKVLKKEIPVKLKEGN